MKKIIKIMLITILIIIINIGLLINTVQAVEEGAQIMIYSKGYFDRIIRNNGIVIKTAHAVYQENGKEYPVYCLNRELHGVGEYIATYNVANKGEITDVGLWRVIINGYPYKSPEQLGTQNEQEAYIATKQAIYCYLYNTGTGLYSAIGEPGTRVISAMDKILENARNSTENIDSPSVQIITQNEKWKVDILDKQYVSKQYEVTSNKNIAKIILNLENQPTGTKITNLENQEKNEFNSNQKFKILIPINSLEESGEFNIKVKTQLETKPIFFGEAPNSELQNYALTAFSYEDFDTEVVQQYEKNGTEIIIQKEDKESEEPLKGAKFEILNENQKIIRIAETNEKGEIILNQLIPGKYYIREIKAPDGYTLDLELREININYNEKITLKVKNERIVIDVPEPEIIEKIQVVENQVIVEVPKLPKTGM